MPFLKSLFGSKSFEDLRSEGDAHFGAKDFGAAKLTYEKALEKTKGAPADAVESVRERIDASRDGIARQRIAEAEHLIEQNELELARTELEGAADTAADPSIAREAEHRMETMERADARERATEVHLSADEVFGSFAAGWDPAQLQEYDDYGEPFREALVALHDERAEEARDKLEAILASAGSPCYLYFEVGRARLLAGDTAGGEEALRTFLERLGPVGEDDETNDDDDMEEIRVISESRFAAYRHLAELADERGDYDAAVDALEKAAVDFEEDPRPKLMLGSYLRRQGYANEAIEVLDAAVAVMGDARPDVIVIQELGLAHMAAGNTNTALSLLEQVITHLSAQQRFDFPPDTAIALATLHEKAGRKERAADLYRALTRGSDRRNHYRYHAEAGRLLAELGLEQEARRMLQRASELAPDDEARAAIATRLEAIDGAEAADKPAEKPAD